MRLECAPRCLDVAGSIGVERGCLLGRVTELLAVLGVIAIVVDGRDIIRAARRHLRKRRVVEIDGVFDRFGTGAHCVTPALRTVRVNGDSLTRCMRGVDGGFHLVECESLIAADVGAAPRRSIHLDPIGTRVDLRFDRHGDVGDRRDAAARRAGRCAGTRRCSLFR